MTIKDIAAETGYSIGTVSRTLNNSPGVSEKARTIIMEVVEKHNFQLNSNARYLKSSGNSGIAIIIKGFQNMFLSAIVERMQGMIVRRGYACQMYYLGEEENELAQALKICAERKPYGIVFVGSNSAYYDKGFSEIPVPCVLATNSAAGLGFDNLSSVSTDDEAAANYAIEYLIANGHRRIGIIGGRTEGSNPSRIRWRGCEQALSEHGIIFNKDKQYAEAHFTTDDGYLAMERLLDQVPDVTAVFAMSDVMAIGAMRAIYDRGLHVPNDISIIGFDGLDLGKYTVPRLTTIRQDQEGIAVDSVEVLLRAVEGSRLAVHKIEPFYLVPGESVHKLK